MMSLLNLDDVTVDEILRIIKQATDFKNGKVVNYDGKKIIGNLFFEPSTRTQYSFETAAYRLGCQVVTLDVSNSSILKGETLYDTVDTFACFNLDALVIRDSRRGYYETLLDIDIPIINGGDGDGDHPTQVLLDLMTIYEQFGKFSGLRVCIVGDIRHSRVARTSFKMMTKLGMKVKFVAPDVFKTDFGVYGEFDDDLEMMDVIYMLRFQNERHGDKYLFETINYQMNEQRLSKINSNAIIMHPGPFNRGVEITDVVVKSSQCVINNQVTNGVYIRMVVLNDELCN